MESTIDVRLVLLVDIMLDCRDTSDSCDIPACSHNELCPNKDICAPGIDAAFIKTQKLCNFIFLFEYIITASTCWSVPARFRGFEITLITIRLAGVLDFYFEKNKDTTSIIEADDKRTSITETPSFVNFSGRLGMKIGEMSWMVTTVFSFNNCELVEW